MINRALRLRPHASGYFWKRRFFLRIPKKYVAHSNRFCASTLKRWNDVYTTTSFTEHVPLMTLKTRRFQKSLLWGTFSKAYVFGARKRRLRVDGRLKRRKKSPFSNKNGYECMLFCVWMCKKRFEYATRGLAFSGYVWKRPNFIPYERVWLMLHWMMN